METSRTQIIILKILQNQQASTPATAITIADMMSVVNFNKSYSTVYREINSLLHYGMVSLGVRDGKYKTFFVNNIGDNLIKEMV
jgi:Fe2+ or Zn2+ uptake regulation protein